MNKLQRSILMAGFIMLTIVTGPAAESLSVLLQKGIFAEETEGNLDAAIQIYEGIVKESEANRSLVAQAQFRLGVCYQKKGQKEEAEAAFRKIMERFGGETELLSKTRERLSEMGKTSRSVVARQVWSPAAEPGHSVSSDGRFLSFTDWETGDLTIRDLTTGKNRHLTDKGPWAKSSQFAETSVISPDGKQVAYNWYPDSGNVELRIISLDAATPRVLWTNSWIRPEAWSGDSIAVVTDILQKECAIQLASTLDGSLRKLKPLPFRQTDRLCFSPDGRYLAYSCAGEKNPESDVFLLDVKSGDESSLVDHPADDKLVGWAADGQRLLFKSDRRGSKDLWAIEVQKGKAKGEPVLLKTEMGEVSILGVTQTGALYYGISRGGVDLYQAAIDLDSGKMLSTPQTLPHPPSASGVLRASLSPSGRYLAYYLSRRGDIHWPELFVSDLETRQHQHLYSVRAPQLVDPPRWLFDERTLVHRGNLSARGTELSLIDARSGAQTSLEDVETDPKLIMEIAGNDQTLAFVVRDTAQKSFLMVRRERKTGQLTKSMLLKEREWNASYHFKIGPDLKGIFYTIVPAERSAERPAVAIRRDLDAGNEYVLMRENSILMPFPSPDPSLVAVASSDGGDPITVRLFRVEENQARELWTAQAPGPINFPTQFGFGWSSDKRYLIYHRNIKELAGNRLQMWMITAETGQVRPLEPAISKLNRIVGVNPQTKQLYFQGWDEGVSEVWVMENFLPPVASAK